MITLVKYQTKKWIRMSFLITLVLFVKIGVVSYYFVELNFLRDYKDWNNEWIIMFLVTFFGCFSSVLRALNTKEIFEIGKVKMYDESIKVIIEQELKEYNFTDIKYVKIKVLGFFGQTIFGEEKAHSETMVLNNNKNQFQGFEHYIVIKLRNKPKKKYNFYLGSKKEYEDLKKLSYSATKVDFEFVR